MKIREATNEDISEIRDMMKNLFLTWDKMDSMDKIDKTWFSSKESSQLIFERMGSESNKYFVAENAGKIIGYIFGLIEIRAACLDKKIGLIDELYMKPEYRKTSAGKALTNKMLGWFKSKKLRWTITLTHSQDEGANSYWKHFGYKDYNRKYGMRL